MKKQSPTTPPKIVKIPPEELAKIDTNQLAREIGWPHDPNDPDLEPCQVYSHLVFGRRTPQNETEQRWLDRIKEIHAAGGVVEMWFD